MTSPASENRLTNQLDLFFGEANPALARAYVRLRPPPPVGVSHTELSLRARLIGPFCEFAETLPLKVQFMSLPSATDASTLIAEAVVPDPNFWTPELPFSYRAEIEVRRGDEVLLQQKRLFGIRRFGARDRFLAFEGKRFVLRGVWQQDDSAWQSGNEWGFARDSWTAVTLPRPSDEACEFASRRGVLVVADLTVESYDAGQLASELHRLAHWPAVAMALLPADAPIENVFSLFAQNLLLAQYTPVGSEFRLAAWAAAAVVEVTDPAKFAEQTYGCMLPVIASRKSTVATSIEQTRAGCDRLQSDLAPFGDFAGYIV
jgi:hypothetical protein